MYANIFTGDNKLSKKAAQTANAQTGVYEKYAGNNGNLSAEEYANALNSSEMDALLGQYAILKSQYANA